MSNIDLTQYGIKGTPKIYHNPSWDELYIDETNPELTGYEKGQNTELGAVNVMTGIYTGRSPKDKFFVEDSVSKDTIWWTSDEYKNDNKPITPQAWDSLKAPCSPLHHGSCMAGSLRDQHVHPPHQGRT